MHAMYTVGRGSAASSGRLPSTRVRGAAFSIINLVERIPASRHTSSCRSLKTTTVRFLSKFVWL